MEGRDWLHRAALSGSVRDAKLTFANFKLDVDEVLNELGWTALHVCARHGHVALLTYLLNRGARIDRTNTFGWSGLHIASFYGRLACVSVLLTHGAHLDQRKKDGQTALHCAGQNTQRSVFRLLVQCGADVNIRDDFGATAFDVARAEVRHSFFDIVAEEARKQRECDLQRKMEWEDLEERRRQAWEQSKQREAEEQRQRGLIHASYSDDEESSDDDVHLSNWSLMLCCASSRKGHKKALEDVQGVGKCPDPGPVGASSTFRDVSSAAFTRPRRKKPTDSDVLPPCVVDSLPAVPASSLPSPPPRPDSVSILMQGRRERQRERARTATVLMHERSTSKAGRAGEPGLRIDRPRRPTRRPTQRKSLLP